MSYRTKTKSYLDSRISDMGTQVRKFHNAPRITFQVLKISMYRLEKKQHEIITASSYCTTISVIRRTYVFVVRIFVVLIVNFIQIVVARYTSLLVPTKERSSMRPAKPAIVLEEKTFLSPISIFHFHTREVLKFRQCAYVSTHTNRWRKLPARFIS